MADDKEVFRTPPLIFISHHGEDGGLAKAFDDLINACTGGSIECFYSAAPTGKEGIETSAEWYPDIVTKIRESSELVALLTPHSFTRPWILWEAGYAKGLGKNVCGLAIGKPLHEVSVGPFAQWQNKDCDPGSLVGLITDIVRRNTRGEPREKALRVFIETFIEATSKAVFSGVGAPSQASPTTTGEQLDRVLSVMARQHEELKRLLAPRERVHVEMTDEEAFSIPSQVRAVGAMVSRLGGFLFERDPRFASEVRELCSALQIPAPTALVDAVLLAMVSDDASAYVRALTELKQVMGSTNLSCIGGDQSKAVHFSRFIATIDAVIVTYETLEGDGAAS